MDRALPQRNSTSPSRKRDTTLTAGTPSSTTTSGTSSFTRFIISVVSSVRRTVRIYTSAALSSKGSLPKSASKLAKMDGGRFVYLSAFSEKDWEITVSRFFSKFSLPLLLSQLPLLLLPLLLLSLLLLQFSELSLRSFADSKTKWIRISARIF